MIMAIKMVPKSQITHKKIFIHLKKIKSLLFSYFAVLWAFRDTVYVTVIVGFKGINRINLLQRKCSTQKHPDRKYLATCWNGQSNMHTHFSHHIGRCMGIKTFAGLEFPFSALFSVLTQSVPPRFVLLRCLQQDRSLWGGTVRIFRHVWFITSFPLNDGRLSASFSSIHLRLQLTVGIWFRYSV